MATLIVLFNLKEGASASEYEAWANRKDVPTVKSLSSVDDFKVFRSSGILGTNATAPYQYVEIIEVNDMNQLGIDISSEKMQVIAAEFDAFAENPTFILAVQSA